MSRLRRKYPEEQGPEPNEGPITFNQIQRIESLMFTAAVPYEVGEYINKMLFLFTFEQALEKILYLSANQIDPINAGVNYSQTDISNKIKNEITGGSSGRQFPERDK